MAAQRPVCLFEKGGNVVALFSLPLLTLHSYVIITIWCLIDKSASLSSGQVCPHACALKWLSAGKVMLFYQRCSRHVLSVSCADRNALLKKLPLRGRSDGVSDRDICICLPSRHTFTREGRLKMSVNKGNL